MKQSWSSVSMEQRTNFCNKHSSIVSTWDFFIFLFFSSHWVRTRGKQNLRQLKVRSMVNKRSTFLISRCHKQELVHQEKIELVLKGKFQPEKQAGEHQAGLCQSLPLPSEKRKEIISGPPQSIHSFHVGNYGECLSSPTSLKLFFLLPYIFKGSVGQNTILILTFFAVLTLSEAGACERSIGSSSLLSKPNCSLSWN